MLSNIIALLVAASSQPQPAPGSATLVKFTRELVQTALTALPKLSPEYRIEALTFAGQYLAGPDDASALKLLHQAWVMAEKSPNLPRWTQGRILENISAISPDRGKALISKIRNRDRRNWLRESLPSALSVRHPKLAAKLFDKTNDVRLMEEILALCEIRLDIGVCYLKMLRVPDLESIVGSVGFNLPAAEAAKFYAAFPLKNARNPGPSWLARHPNASAPQIERAAASMPHVYDRVLLTLKAIEAHRSSNRGRGALLADQLCDEAKRNGPKPVFRMGPVNGSPLDSLALDWKHVLLPDIANADTPKVRRYLDTSLGKGDNGLEMRRIHAWSKIDIQKATRLTNEFLASHSGVDSSCFGPYLDDGYKGYLENLLKTDPRQVVRRLQACDLSGNGPSGPPRLWPVLGRYASSRKTLANSSQASERVLCTTFTVERRVRSQVRIADRLSRNRPKGKGQSSKQ